MTTVQIVGIAVAAAIVILLVIALLVTRRHDAAEDERARAAETSFLDEAPTDTLSRLGKAEHQTVTAPLSPEPEQAERGGPFGPTRVAAAGTAAHRNNGDLSLDWGPSGGATAGIEDDLLAPEPDDSETTGRLPAVGQPGAAPSVVAAEPAAGEQAAGAPAPERTAGPEATPDEPRGRRVPLSDIIVTTSSKMVDLDDPEVRHMLTDLVTFEIDQATQYRQQGQDIDAVLQLTEAEKISRALGLDETAERIREMMADLHA